MKEYIFEIHYCNCSIKKDDIVRIATPDSVSEDKTGEAFRTAMRRVQEEYEAWIQSEDDSHDMYDVDTLIDRYLDEAVREIDGVWDGRKHIDGFYAIGD